MTDLHPSIRVILADQHAPKRARLRQFLERAGGIQFLAEAGDGKTTLAIIQSIQPDVAVLNIHMPEISGIEISCRVRANHWPVKLLMLTSCDDAPYVAPVLQARANGYILDTASRDEIIRAVRDVNQGKIVEFLDKVLR